MAAAVLIMLLPYSRSKTKGDAADSKYLLLDGSAGGEPPKGESKGVVKRVRVSGPNLLITMESGEFLELKVGSAVLVELIVVQSVKMVCECCVGTAVIRGIATSGEARRGLGDRDQGLRSLHMIPVM